MCVQPKYTFITAELGTTMTAIFTYSQSPHTVFTKPVYMHMHTYALIHFWLSSSTKDNAINKLFQITVPVI